MNENNGKVGGLPPEFDPVEPSEAPHREPQEKEPRRAPTEPQPPSPPDSPDFHKVNQDLRDAVLTEDEFLQEEVLGQGAQPTDDPQNEQTNTEEALEDGSSPTL